MSVVLAFFAAIAWGASDFYGGVASKKAHSLTVTLCREVVQIVLYAGIILFTNGVFHWSDFGLCFGLGLLLGVALPVFFGALAGGRMAVVAPVAGVVGALLPIAVGVAGGERPSLWQGGGLVLAVMAVALVSVEHVDDGGDGARRHFAVADMVTATFCGSIFGLFFVGTHHTSRDSGMWPLSAVCFGLVCVIVPWMVKNKVPGLRSVTPSLFRICAIGGALDVVAAGLYLLATRQGLLAVTAGVAGLYPVATALMAWHLLKERLTPMNMAGLILSAASLALVAL